MILAAGVGRRYGGLKQLEPVGPGGEAILEYSIFDARRAGFGRVVLVVRPETEAAFRGSLGRRLPADLPLAYAFQTLDDLPAGRMPPCGRTRPWGTGHALLAAAEHVPGPFAVANADDLYGASAWRALADFLRRAKEGDAALAGFALGPTLSDTGPVSRALCRLAGDGSLADLVEVREIHRDGGDGRYVDEDGEERTVAGDELVSMNLWGFTPAIFAELRQRFRAFLDREGDLGGSELLLPDVVRDLLADGRLRVEVLRHDGAWCGVTFPEDRARVIAKIAQWVRQGRYPARLWNHGGR